jgi:hypothetical protein
MSSPDLFRKSFLAFWDPDLNQNNEKSQVKSQSHDFVKQAKQVWSSPVKKDYFFRFSVVNRPEKTLFLLKKCTKMVVRKWVIKWAFVRCP